MKKVFLVFITIILVVNAGMFLTGNRHLYKAIYHTYADIDDYKIFENNTIAANSGAPWNLHTSYNKSTMLQDFDTLMEAWDSKAFVIIKNDSLLFEKYWDGYNDTTISGSFSVAKSIVNVLVGCALREGKIRSLDDAVGNYIDEFNIGVNNKITIRCSSCCCINLKTFSKIEKGRLYVIFITIIAKVFLAITIKIFKNLAN